MRVTRRVAAHDDRLRAGILPRQLPNYLPRFGIARVRHCTRIDYAQGCRLIVIRFPVAAL